MLTEEQQRIRSKGIGASETAALLGMDPYATAMDVWLRKKGLTQNVDTYHTKRGNYLEPALRQWASDSVGVMFDAITSTMTCPQSAHVLATPDGVGYRLFDAPAAEQVVTLELKAPGPRTWHEWGDGDDAPDRYVVQVVQQMLVMGAAEGYLCALVDGDLKVYRYERDPELEGVIVESIERFWRDHIEAEVPPDLDGSPAADAWLKSRFPRSRGPMVVASGEQEELLAKYRAARTEREAMEARETVLKQRIQEAIGDSDGIESPVLGKIYWRTQKGRTMLDGKRLRAELPEIAEKYTTTTAATRVFRPYLKGDIHEQ